MGRPPSQLIALLACPLCHMTVTDHDHRVECANRHSFDVARQGYIAMLLSDAATTGDTPPMIAARERLNTAGIYDGIVASIDRALALQPIPAHPVARNGRPDGRVILDAGGGTGHIVAQLLRHGHAESGVVLDLSRAAIQRAARVHDAVMAVRSDIWGTWPIGDHCIDAALHVFAPRNPTQLFRVLRPGGIAIVVTPQPEHLQELVEAFSLVGIDSTKHARLGAAFAHGFVPAAMTSHTTTWRLSHAHVADVVMAGPTGAHLTTDTLDLARQRQFARLPDTIEVTAAWNVQMFIAQPQ